VPNRGDAAHGFPYLSGGGPLVIKDAIMMGAALVTMADSARLKASRPAILRLNNVVRIRGALAGLDYNQGRTQLIPH
jgi:hypothetical protein